MNHPLPLVLLVLPCPPCLPQLDLGRLRESVATLFVKPLTSKPGLNGSSCELMSVCCSAPRAKVGGRGWKIKRRREGGRGKEGREKGRGRERERVNERER